MAETLWHTLRAEARDFARTEPALASFYHASVINHPHLGAALSYILAQKLASQDLPAILLRQVIEEALRSDAAILKATVRDIYACVERDPACSHHLLPLLFFKGFQALQAYRISHWLWHQRRQALALYFQNQIAQTFAVDIHPAAHIGAGILMDHATGIVIGETARVGDDVSMLHGVTLGGSGYQSGQRHPQVASGVLIAAGARVLGNIAIGEGAKIGAGSLVLAPVPAHTTVAGVPARPVGTPKSDRPAQTMNHDA